MGGHGKCYLVTTGRDDGATYYMFCKRYKDPCETKFKALVRQRAGGTGSVHRKNSEPTRGIDLGSC